MEIIGEFIDKMRRGVATNREIASLFSHFKAREKFLAKYYVKNYNLYEWEDLISYYYEGVMGAIYYKKNDGFLVDVENDSNIIIGVINSFAVNNIKVFLNEVSVKNLLFSCPTCGVIHSLRALKCRSCHSKFGKSDRFLKGDAFEDDKFEEDFCTLDSFESTLGTNLFLSEIRSRLEETKKEIYLKVFDLLIDPVVVKSNNYLKKIGDILGICVQLVSYYVGNIKNMTIRLGYSP